MKKISIIGHRGAAGLELENTETSILRALSYNLSALEVDVRITKDNKPVVIHDGDMSRVSADTRKIRDLTLAEIQTIPLHDGSKSPSLERVLEIVGNHPIIIELKDSGSIRPVLKVLNEFPQANIRLASFKLEELALARSLAPSIFLYGLERTKPFECIQLARILKLDGVGLNYWLLNPLTYWYAQRSGLQVYVYTVNDKFFAKFLNYLYPRVAICTDYPDYFVKRLRRKDQNINPKPKE